MGQQKHGIVRPQDTGDSKDTGENKDGTVKTWDSEDTAGQYCVREYALSGTFWGSVRSHEVALRTAPGVRFP